MGRFRGEDWDPSEEDKQASRQEEAFETGREDDQGFDFDEESKEPAEELPVSEEDEADATEEVEQARQRVEEAFEDSETLEDEESELGEPLEAMLDDLKEHLDENQREFIEEHFPAIKDLIVEVMKAAKEGREYESEDGKTWEEVILEEIPGLLGVLLILAIKIMLAALKIEDKARKKSS